MLRSGNLLTVLAYKEVSTGGLHLDKHGGVEEHDNW